MKSERALKTALTRIRAVSLEGTAIRVVDEEWSDPRDVVSGVGAVAKGGRFNAAGTFRTVYLTEDSRNGLREINYPVSAGGKFEVVGAWRVTVVPVEFRLERVLNLCDFHVRIELGTDRDEILQNIELFEARGEEAPSQTLGRVARKNGWSAILYPSRHTPKVGNLAVFPDNLGPGDYLRPQETKSRAPWHKRGG